MIEAEPPRFSGRLFLGVAGSVVAGLEREQAVAVASLEGVPGELADGPGARGPAVQGSSRVIGQEGGRESREGGPGEDRASGEEFGELFTVENFTGADGLPLNVLVALEGGDEQLASLGVHHGAGVLDIVGQLCGQHPQRIDGDNSSVGREGKCFGSGDGNSQAGKRTRAVSQSDHLHATGAPISVSQQLVHGGGQRLRGAAIRRQCRLADHVRLLEQSYGALQRGCFQSENSHVPNSCTRISNDCAGCHVAGGAQGHTRQWDKGRRGGDSRPFTFPTLKWHSPLPQIRCADPCTPCCTILDFRSRLFGLYLRQHSPFSWHSPPAVRRGVGTER